MPVTVVLELHLKPKTISDQLEDLRQQVPATLAFDGCLGVDAFVDHDDPGTSC